MNRLDRFLARRIARVLAASGTKNPADWFIEWIGGAPTGGGTKVSSASVMGLPIAYACVNVLAQDIAKLPLVTYRRLARGKEREPTHPVARVLRQPNKFQTEYDFRAMLQGHLALRGNAYAEIVRNRVGGIEALMPLHPDAVTTLVTEARDDVAYDVLRHTGAVERLPRSRVMHLRGLASDGFVGMSPITVQRETFALSQTAREHETKTLANGARLSGALIVPQALGPEAAKLVTDDFERRHKGPENAGKIALLDAGMDYKTIGMSQKDAQFVETMALQGSDIARVFRMPPHKVGILDKATFSNIEHQALEYVTDTLMPWLRCWESAIQRDLFTERDRDLFFAEFLIDALLRGDTKSRYEAHAIAIANGMKSPNEVRETENMNPYDAGDVYLRQANTVPIDTPAAAPGAARPADREVA